MQKMYAVYILTNMTNTVLYIGVTDNLARRVHEHKLKAVPGFTRQYNVTRLVYAELTDDLMAARTRERQLKSWGRKKKEELINRLNPQWLELEADPIN